MEEMAGQTSFRASVESALARRFQVLGEHLRGPRTSGAPSTLVHEYITEDINYLCCLIPSYWLRLNRIRSPLLRLPSELLPMILYAATSNANDRTRLIIWIQLGHVCHDLRDALLGMHALWADVVFDPRYTLVQEELLARAGSCPINISLGYHATPQRVRRAIELLTRARKVDAHPKTHPDQTKYIIEALKQGTNPELEELGLGYDRNEPTTHGNILASVDLPKLTAPKLRAIDFTDTFIPVDLACLRNLSLSWYSMEPTPIPEARTFTDMISSCGRLEKLTLRDGWIPACSALKSLCRSEYRISLPHLTYLELWQDMEHILAFWDVLTIPISTTVLVEYQPAAWEEPDCDLKDLLVRTRSLRAFLSQTQRRGISQVSKISVYRNDEGILDVKLGTTDSAKLPPGIESGSRQTPSSLPWKPWRNYTLGFSTCTVVEKPDEIVSFLECLCTVFQMHVDNIDTVGYTWATEPLALDERNQDSYILYAVFPATTALCLSIDYPPCVDVGCILSPLSPQGFDYLPKLHTLHLDQTFSQAGVERLIDALNMRADYGRPVRVLTLSHKFLESDPETGMEDEEEEEEDAIERRLLLVRRLQDIVPHVRFDEFQ
ncbi:hypothetical protein PENSPDRAFT_759990 [Peniophora sp. CONT]|nr:hypothetical protein PENSPDRAFT_759990 [Peniophora sp. CONT]